MDPVLKAFLDTFVGGELEVQNPVEGYTYRGEIATIEAITPREYTGDTLKVTIGSILRVTLSWNAKAVGPDDNPSQYPTDGWAEDTTLTYECNTELPSPEIDAPNIPNVSLIGEGRMAINNPYTNELTVLFPRTGSKLSHDKVRWLPDGPKSKLEAAQGERQQEQ